ncbi:uncharacterized protein METZ01_LOCUS257356 [marine metagenome]|uniref:Uncharacterized protein n=1 Tax=marine metagenome TaxID=408172 RepID=A0A382IZB0_9ZZZZ
MVTTKPSQETRPKPLQRIKQFSSRYKSEIGLSVLVLYVFLLGLGTVGEVWDIEWILDLPIFRPPGRY